MDLNNFSATGYVARGPDLKYVGQAGTLPMIRFTLGNHPKANSDTTNYIPCVMFGEIAETMMEYIATGKRVAINGIVQWRRWQDDDGNWTGETNVLCNRVIFMDTVSDNKTSESVPKKSDEDTEEDTNDIEDASEEDAPLDDDDLW